MDIYLVKPGDSLYHIARRFRVPMDQLIQDNTLYHPERLVVGQALVVRNPEREKDVQTGEDLRTIADEVELSIGVLLRRNLKLHGKEQISPGQSLALSYEGSKSCHSLALLGGVSPRQRQAVLPFLTAPLSAPYQFTSSGVLIPPVYQPVVHNGQFAESRPLLVVQDHGTKMEQSDKLVHELLNNQQSRKTFQSQLMNILDKTDGQGVLLSFSSVDSEDAHSYTQFIEELRHSLPYNTVLVTALPARAFEDSSTCGLLCGQISQVVDLVLIAQTTPYRSAPGPLFSAPELEALLQKVLIHIPPEKCILELSSAGYDWLLPYQTNIAPTPLSSMEIIELAWKHHVSIRRDHSGGPPWFRYSDDFGLEHQVHFQDPVSLLSQLNIVKNYSLYGLSFPDVEDISLENLILLDSKFCIRELLK